MFLFRNENSAGAIHERNRQKKQPPLKLLPSNAVNAVNAVPDDS